MRSRSSSSDSLLELGLEGGDPRDPLLVLAELLGLADVQRAVKKAHERQRSSGKRRFRRVGGALAAASARPPGRPAGGVGRRAAVPRGAAERGLRAAAGVLAGVVRMLCVPPCGACAACRVALDLAGELLLAEVDRVPQVAGAVARAEGRPLEVEGGLGHLRLADRRVALLPELHLQARELRDLPADRLKRFSTCSRSSSVTGTFRPLTSICMELLSSGCGAPRVRPARGPLKARV